MTNSSQSETRWTPEPPTKRGHPFVLTRKDHREAVKLDQHQFGSNWPQFGLYLLRLAGWCVLVYVLAALLAALRVPPSLLLFVFLSSTFTWLRRRSQMPSTLSGDIHFDNDRLVVVLSDDSLTFTLGSQSRWLVGDQVTLLYEGPGRKFMPIPHGVMSLPAQQELDERLRTLVGPPLEHRSRFEDRRSEPEKAVLAFLGVAVFIAVCTPISMWLTS